MNRLNFLMIGLGKCMTRVILLCWLTIAFSGSVKAQSWDWAVTQKCAINIEGNGCSYTNSKGISVFAGVFHDSVTLGQTKLVYPGESRIYFCLTNANGEIIRGFSDGRLDYGGDALLMDITMDAYGRIILVGMCGNIAFGNTVHETETSDFFIAVFSMEGDLIWSDVSGSDGMSNIESYNSVSADHEGNVYATGWYNDYTLDFQGHQLSGPVSENAFIVKFNFYGEVQWVRTNELEFDPSYTNYSYGTSVMASDDAVYWTGRFYNAFEMNSTRLESQGLSDVFVASFSTDGELNWLKRDGGEFSEYPIASTLIGDSIMVMTGIYQGNYTSIAGVTLPNAIHDGYPVTSTFLAAYDTDGNGKWAIPLLTPHDEPLASPSYANLYDIVFDYNQSVWLSGQFNGTIMSGDQQITSESSSKNSLLVKCDISNGQVTESIVFGGNEPNGAVFVGADECSNVYGGGYFYNAMTFGSHTFSAEGRSVYLARYEVSTDCIVTALQSSKEESELLFFPNPASEHVQVTLPYESAEAWNVTVHDAQGSKIKEIEVHPLEGSFVLTLPPEKGIYMIRCLEGERILSGKVIVAD